MGGSGRHKLYEGCENCCVGLETGSLEPAQMVMEGARRGRRRQRTPSHKVPKKRGEKGTQHRWSWHEEMPASACAWRCSGRSAAGGLGARL